MKKILLIATVVLLGAVAQADVLYWQISNNVTYDTGATFDYSYATISSISGDTKTLLNTTYVGNNTTAESKIDASAFSRGGTEAATVIGTVIGDRAGETFVIELWDSSNNLVGFANSPSNLGDYIADNAQFSSSWSMMNSSWTVTQAVPEPTSGMLLMLGAALLALKRRKVA